MQKLERLRGGMRTLTASSAQLRGYATSLERPDPAQAQIPAGHGWQELATDVGRMDPGRLATKLQEGLQTAVESLEDGPVTREKVASWVRERLAKETAAMHPKDDGSRWVDYTSEHGANLGPIVEHPRPYRGLVGGTDADPFPPAFPRAVDGEMKGYLVEQKLELFKHAHWRLYPRKVRGWLYDALMPRGMYDSKGNWVEGGTNAASEAAVARMEAFSVFRLPPEPRRDDAVAADVISKPLPAALANRFRFGVTEADLKAVGANDRLRLVLSFHFAPQRERRSELVRQAVEKFGTSPWDCGCSEVQVAALTLKIRDMIAHLQRNVKDSAMKRSLQKIVSRRRKLMSYLKRTNLEGYFRVLQEYNLRDMVY